MSKRTLYRRAAKATAADLESISRELHSSYHGHSEDFPLHSPVLCSSSSEEVLVSPHHDQPPNESEVDHPVVHNVEVSANDEDFVHFALPDCESIDAMNLGFSEQKSLSSTLADWALEGNISHKSFTRLLKILKPLHPDLPSDARTLLGTVRHKAPVLPMGKGSFIYFGLAGNLKKLLCENNLDSPELVLTFNIDGQSPFKHSKLELWPILCKVDNISHKPLLICSYYGRGKP